MGLFSPKTPLWMQDGLACTPKIDRALHQLQRLKDVPKLIEAGIGATDVALCNQAVWRLKELDEQAALREVALAQTSASGEATRAIKDPAVLVEIARTAKTQWARFAALECIDDQAVFLEAALNDRALDVRKKAISLLADPADIERVARENFDTRDRRAALARIDDEALRADIEASWSAEQLAEDERQAEEARQWKVFIAKEQARHAREQQERERQKELSRKWASEGRCPNCGVLLTTPSGGIPDGAAVYCSNCNKRIR